MTQEPEDRKLDFSLPPRDRAITLKAPKSLIFLYVLVLLAILVDIGLDMGFSAWKPESPRSATTEGSSLSPDAQKDLALKLEKQDLNQASISAWKQYLSIASLDNGEAAKIWYRIGKLYQQERRYEEALESFYRSESFATVPELAPEISRRVQDCLESAGKFAALRYELSDRVGMSPSPDGNKPVSKGDEVVAEIGPEKITESDLDQWIEAQIEGQLSRMAPYMPDEQLKKQKEALLKEFSISSQRQMLLGQMIGEEVLYRKAIELKLPEDPKVQAEIKRQERALLAGDLMQKEFAQRINITESDLKTYYEAHRQDYTTEAEEEGSEPAQKPFEDVRSEIYQTLRSQKQQEVQQNMLGELKETYDVVIHRSAFENDRAEQDADAAMAAQGKGVAGGPSGKPATAQSPGEANPAPPAESADADK